MVHEVNHKVKLAYWDLLWWNFWSLSQRSKARDNYVKMIMREQKSTLGEAIDAITGAHYHIDVGQLLPLHGLK